MPNEKWTKGPWISEKATGVRWPRVMAGKQVIANTIYGLANARLIAAAPELISALRSTLSTLDFAISKGVLECHGVREAAIAAIAKAEGSAVDCHYEYEKDGSIKATCAKCGAYPVSGRFRSNA